MASRLGMLGKKNYTETQKPASKVISAADRKALPIMGTENERKLCTHINDRLKLSSDERARRATRAQKIDTQISGFVKLSKDDQKRERANTTGEAARPTKHNLPLASAQLDEATTYLMSVYAPEMDIFEAVAPADKQQLAQAVTSEINKQGQRAQYYRYLTKFCLNAVKYNFGGMTCYWDKYQGIVFKGAAGGIATRAKGTVFEGNVLNSVDVYNFFYDTSVHPVDLPTQGEYFAEVERLTPFRVRKLAADGMLFGINRYIDEVFGAVSAPGGSGGANGESYYIVPPSVRSDDDAFSANDTRGTTINWVNLLRTSNVKESSPGLEIVKFTAWICPNDFGLSSSTELELWRIKMANAKYITYAMPLMDCHGMLPIVMAAPLEDDLRNEQRTYAEQLIPLQHFASFLMNSHQEATRKSIAGITVYNQNLFPGLDKDTEDLIGAKIPFRGSSTDIDIDKAFRHYTDSPGTEHNVEQIGEIIALMQKILPTDMAKQVADLERATLYQAAATVQAGNRRQLKIARIIDSQALQWLKFQMLYNLYGNLPTISYIDEATGQRMEVSVADCIEAGIEYEISTGLKGIDRLMTIQIMREVINSVIQSQQGLQEIDLVSLLNYFANLAGDRTDLAQFRKQPVQQPAGVPGAAPGGAPQQNPPPNNAPGPNIPGAQNPAGPAA